MLTARSLLFQPSAARTWHELAASPAIDRWAIFSCQLMRTKSPGTADSPSKNPCRFLDLSSECARPKLTGKSSPRILTRASGCNLLQGRGASHASTSCLALK